MFDLRIVSNRESLAARLPAVRCYLRAELFHDLAAGLTGATAGAPQAMGFAILAGLSPVYGLYTAIVSTVVGALTGGVGYMTTGPTNALALVVGSTLGSGDTVSRLVTLTVLVGVIQLVFGLLRLGGLTRYVSTAVMTGFITGAALLIIIGQMGYLTGISVGRQPNAIRSVTVLVEHSGTLGIETTVIGVVTMAVILTLHHTPLKPFATLTAITITGIWIALVGWETQGVELVRDMAPIPNRLPGMTLPDASLARDLLSGALAIALLGLVQTAALAESLAVQRRMRVNISREFIGQGASNLIGGLFQNMPAGGSLSRTAVNISAGARTRLANLYAGVFVALIILLFGGLAERIALAALAGHLIVAAMSLIQMKQIRFVWQAGLPSRAVLMITLAATLVLPLEYSVYVGVGLTLLLYVGQSSHVSVMRLEPAGDTFRETPVPDRLPDHEPVIVQVTGNLSFAAARDLQTKLPSPAGARHPVVILRLRGDELLAGTGAALLAAYAEQFHDQHGKLILCGVSEQVTHTLQSTGVLDTVGPENVFPATDTLLTSTRAALAYAQGWLAEQPGAKA